MSETPFGCVTCNSDPTYLIEEPPTLYCTAHKPDSAIELCRSCRPCATDQNHPSGMVFVGWGHGWQSCANCGGSGLQRTVMMTFKVFKRLEPQKAYWLEARFGHCVIDGIYQVDNRYQAHLSVPPTGAFEIVYEARCHLNCFRGASDQPFYWVTESHVCCESCRVDPAHRYQTVHE